MLNDLILRLRALFKRTTVEHEIDDELRFHLERRQVESYEKAGIDHSDALRRARLQFGGLDQAKEEYRDTLGVRLVDDVRRDLRHTIRSLRATPAFSLAVIVTLALGIGANAAVFSMINSVLLLPLRFNEPARLFLVRAHSEKDGAPTSYSYLDFLDARRGSGSFEGMAAWRGQVANLSGIGEPESVQTRQASAGNSRPRRTARERIR
jgi:putative ABC transport system permease protein